MITGNVL